MQKDLSGITNAMKETQAVIDCVNNFTAVPPLTHSETRDFSSITGIPYFTAHAIERGLLAGAANAQNVKRGKGVEISSALDRLYDFRRAARHVIASRQVA